MTVGRSPVIPALTPRESEVLNRAADGLSTVEIAEALDIATSTVRTHRDNILRKLRVHTLTGAVGVGFRTGLLR